MLPADDELAAKREFLERASQRVLDQIALIEKLKDTGGDTRPAEMLLSEFIYVQQTIIRQISAMETNILSPKAIHNVVTDSAVMDPSDARERLSAEIRRLVMGAARVGSIVRTDYYAGMLANTYADAGLSIEQIVEAIATAAVKRGVPVEIATPK